MCVGRRHEHVRRRNRETHAQSGIERHLLQILIGTNEVNSYETDLYDTKNLDT